MKVSVLVWQLDEAMTLTTDTEALEADHDKAQTEELGADRDKAQSSGDVGLDACE